MMLSPLKILNLDDLAPVSDSEVVFIPGHMDICYREGSRLFVNFFRIKADLYEEDKLTIEDKDIFQWFREKLEA